MSLVTWPKVGQLTRSESRMWLGNDTLPTVPSYICCGHAAVGAGGDQRT